nr:KrmF [uncultured bacterium]
MTPFLIFITAELKGARMIGRLTVVIFALIITIWLISPMVSVAQHTPYAGQQHREIKALSSQEIQSYLSGHGMAFAKAAELNHYPGPMHVLEHAQALQLTKRQRTQTQAIFDAMRQEAIELGHQLVQAERHLDHLFSTQAVTEDTLQEATRTIATYRGRLRHVHLRAHLAQRRVLNAKQIQRYDDWRGYPASGFNHPPHRHHH